MVCSLGNGRMAIMARMLNSAQTIQDDLVGKQKLAAQFLQRELKDADEPNLLDEEDMHIFGLRPTTDPLDLVCCNACKKPVKASHIATHTEICRFLKSVEETVSEPNGNTAFSVDVASMMNGKGVSPENTDHSASVMLPPTKRSKVVSSQHQSLSNDAEAAFGLTKVTSIQDTITYVPAPLATKIYYSQKNGRLRSAIAHMYYASVSGNNVMIPEVSQLNTQHLQAESHQGCSQELDDGLSNKKVENSACNRDQSLLQCSEMCLDQSRQCIPTSDISSPLPVDDVLRPQTTSLGSQKSKYVQRPYSFTGNSGQTILQPIESVPVL